MCKKEEFMISQMSWKVNNYFIIRNQELVTQKRSLKIKLNEQGQMNKISQLDMNYSKNEKNLMSLNKLIKNQMNPLRKFKQCSLVFPIMRPLNILI